MVTCVLLGACTTLAIFLAATTVYYRRKAHQLQVQNKTGVVDLRRRDEDSDEGVERRQETVKDDHRVHREGRRGEVRRDNRGRRDPGWHYPQRGYSEVNG